MNTANDAVYTVLVRVQQGELTLHEACNSLGVHRSTLWRKLNRIRNEGAAGLRHRLAGRPSNRRLPEQLRAKVLDVFRQANGAPVTELYRELAQKHGVNASYATLTRWLRTEGLVASAPRRRQRVAGEAVIVCHSNGLILIVDHATSHVVGSSEAQGYQGLKRAMAMMVEREGLPMRIVIDRAILASYTSPDKRHFKTACEKLGMSLGTSLPQGFEAPPAAQMQAVTVESVFVKPNDDRWRKNLA